MRRTKIKPADKWFSLCVRERADWQCERCGKYVQRPGETGTRTGLDCSHLIGRRHRAGRWSGECAVAHCVSCHNHLTENPVEFSDWIRRTFGDARIELLRDKINAIQKVTKQDEAEIAAHYKHEYELMCRLRASGRRGRIEFDDYF